ncbi:MAG: septum site-determining protein MinC [Lachnospiraceae bacterium]|nr:septum site-determining protein MinC [Lachnospiraceae bacterium]
MSQAVVIKGNKYGITLALDKDMPFDELLDKIKKKFNASAKFFDTKEELAICFEGRELNTEEQTTILDIIDEEVTAHFGVIIENSELIDQIFKAKLKGEELIEEDEESDEVEETKDESEDKIELISKDNVSVIPTHAPKGTTGSIDNVSSNVKEIEVSDDLGHFYRGTLRSGQSIEFASSIVVIGDVNPGAKVIAKGNIIVIGSLKGAAYAGVNGNKNSFIIALDMDPMQLRIGNLYARSPDSKGFLKKKKHAVQQMQIAYVEGDNIYIEPINRTVLNTIIY